ncbi:hypothetical protein HN51_056804 [Arachis hypogaea]|uniref:Uncharacterized protein n=1 Tax=Arachis hypogaea TaxID=3818 RepID=A0A6B9VDX1_ARAHY|nr:uncharacterized protein LOC107616149 [Arachis ipaensis]XP_025679583.1 uncharacterized protein LOC112779499 [Arachis hypogaea]QHN79749.1 uncharacterized protein DS421_19g672630 [Arachis hypogaea]
MQSRTCLFSLGLPSLPPPPRRNSSLPFISHTNRRSFICASSSYGHHNYNDGKLVDEDMITLRWRIREIEMDENNNNEGPSDWMSKLEKKYFANYESDVCEAVGFLQRMLMDTRPSFAFAMVALLMLTMSTSASLLLFNLVHYLLANPIM